MSKNLEQRWYIKFCHKLGKTATETYQIVLMTYGNEIISHARISEWFKRLKEGRQIVEKDEHDRRHSTSYNEEMI